MPARWQLAEPPVLERREVHPDAALAEVDGGIRASLPAHEPRGAVALPGGRSLAGPLLLVLRRHGSTFGPSSSMNVVAPSWALTAQEGLGHGQGTFHATAFLPAAVLRPIRGRGRLPTQDELTDALSLALAGFAVLCGVLLIAAPSSALLACGVMLPGATAVALSA